MATQAERRQTTRDAVVEAAIAAFTEAGGIEVGLDEIAGRAGVAKSTVLYHFGSRAAVLRSVAVRLFTAQEAQLGPLDAGAAAWVAALLRLQLGADARLLNQVGDELALAGELGGADPVAYLTSRLGGVGVDGDARVVASAIVQFSRQLAYGMIDGDEIDPIVAALVRGVRLA